MPRQIHQLSALLRDALLDAQANPRDGAFDPLPERFRFLRKIGQGGWGAVWVARDQNLNRLVAVKLIASERAELATQILRNEGAQLARLRPHPNIVQVYSWECVGETCFVTLQYVGGGSLRAALDTFGPMKWSTAARYIADTADGLLRLHDHGLLHRDIKPDNLLLDIEQDIVLLTDFGFAGTPAEMNTPAGTPGYAAPEALYQAAVPASDVYSLAATFFDLITGRPPFQGNSVEEIVAAACVGAVPALSPDLLPPRLGDLIRAALAPRIEDRPGLKSLRDELRVSTNVVTTDTLFASPIGAASTSERPSVSLRVCRTGASGRREEVRPLDGHHRTRDLAYASAPTTVRIYDGDLLQLSIEASSEGYLTVLNVGPSGALTVLLPNEDLPEARIAPGRAFLFPPAEGGRIEVRPPSGVERIVTIWTRHKPQFNAEQLYGRLIRRDVAPEDAGAYYATRQLVYVAKEAERLDPSDVTWQVTSIDHCPQSDPQDR
jgi:serine/threonine protein kinase